MTVQDVTDEVAAWSKLARSVVGGLVGLFRRKPRTTPRVDAPKITGADLKQRESNAYIVSREGTRREL
jgi:hypothetical protein